MSSWCRETRMQFRPSVSLVYQTNFNMTMTVVEIAITLCQDLMIGTTKSTKGGLDKQIQNDPSC